jgi:hypothetical protein
MIRRIFLLAAVALVVSTIIGIPLGIVSGSRRGRLSSRSPREVMARISSSPPTAARLDQGAAGGASRGAHERPAAHVRRDHAELDEFPVGARYGEAVDAQLQRQRGRRRHGRSVAGTVADVRI